MITNIFILTVSLFLVVRGAGFAIKYAARLAENFRLSKYVIGFIIVAVISILPETFIAMNAAIEKIPSFGLGMLFGSNIADLTLVFAVILLIAGRQVKVESKILENRKVYPFLLLLPLILGLNGHYSRVEGAALIIAGGIFYYFAIKSGISRAEIYNPNGRLKNFLLLLAGMALILVGSHFVVTSSTSLAGTLKINPVLIGMLVVGIGTTLPELFFSLRCVKSKEDSLAIGDILGTVLADATIVVGILALISPFFFPVRIIYVTGIFMVLASVVLFYFMHSGRALSKKEAWLLFGFWLIFVVVEYLVNK